MQLIILFQIHRQGSAAILNLDLILDPDANGIVSILEKVHFSLCLDEIHIHH